VGPLCVPELKFPPRRLARSIARCWRPPQTGLSTAPMSVAAGPPRPVHRSHRPSGGLERQPVWFEYLRGGLGCPKGGRRHQNLTLSQERSLLAPWQQQARRGRLVTARKPQNRLRAALGRMVTDSTVCRLLARHQWRRVVPRPKHPKDNPAARAAFKKTSGQSGRGGGWAPAPTVAAAV
jgi:hypothetical protein